MTADNLEQCVSSSSPIPKDGKRSANQSFINESQAIEEAFFLGLRLTRGVDLVELAERYGTGASIAFREEFAELASAGLVEVEEGCIRLTSRGRLLSNEVFSRLISSEVTTSPETN